MRYTIRHTTQYRYTGLVSESVTEVRMLPRTTERQTCLSFRLQVRPAAEVLSFQDALGNVVHHFTQPAAHRELTIIAESEIQTYPAPQLPARLAPEDWDRIDEAGQTGEYWDWLQPSDATGATALLASLARELGVERRNDPLSVLLGLNMALHRTFAYDSKSTRVDSPIDEALTYRRGVCQDFSHIMLALVRNYLHVPCRYVSGYLHPRTEDSSATGATHAWVEAWLPDLGWVGFDPTNNLLAGERHVQVAIGRDYADVPPARGVFKGNAGSELTVTVKVRGTQDAAPEPEGEADAAGADTTERPAYRVTATQLQERYVQTLAAIQVQQQQQQQQ
jgi:transglutaminase-like putative cysteine protease